MYICILNHVIMIDSFDDIRPYNDAEIPAAMQRLTSHTAFPMIAAWLFPEWSVEKVRDILLSSRSVDEFQARFMDPCVRSIIRQTTEGVTFNGLEKLDRSKKYLLVSNHRDIVLDAMLLTWKMQQVGLGTPEITFGANLMQGELPIDFGKSNKMFKVERPSTTASPREFFAFSQRLSAYIRYSLTVKHEHVWIAHRNGRTKDGDDATDQGIIKMFGMSGPDDKVEALSQLNIVPVSVSYEWEPCDVLKVLEIYESSQRGTYTKKPGEDMNSILTGLLENKGRVHFEINDPIRKEELLALDGFTRSRFNKEVAELLDRRIIGGYKLWPNNFIAHDIRYGQTKYASEYTPAQRDAFKKRLSSLSRFDTCDIDTLKDLMLSIYATPVDRVCGIVKK